MGVKKKQQLYNFCLHPFSSLYRTPPTNITTMMKSIVSALSFYAAVNGQAQFPAVDPVAPVAPAAPVDPVAPAAPVVPQGPVVIPIIPPPATPGSGTPLSLVCGLECTSTANCPSTCAQTVRTIDAPGNSFTMECTGMGSCAASQYTFDYASAGALTRYFEGIQVGAAYALYGSTITFDNSARGGGLTVRTIDCGQTLCAGATFRFLNADFGDITCEEYSGCGAGCMVEMPPDAPVACDLVSTT